MIETPSDLEPANLTSRWRWIRSVSMKAADRGRRSWLAGSAGGRSFVTERSLVGVADRAKREYSISTRRQRFRSGLLTPGWQFLKGQWSFVAVVLIAIGGAFLPISWSLRPLTDTARAANFLQALWQVEASTLAVALTVVVFVFATVYSSRIRGSLRQFAEETGLFPIFYVGLVALALDAVVLLGGGEGASGGWAATWAGFWAALDGVLLGVLFVSTIRAIEESSMERRRTARARREVQRETERVILKRIALNALDGYAESVGIEYTPVFGMTPSAATVAVAAGRAGEISDIRLRRLRRLGRLAKKIGAPPPRLVSQLDRRITAETTILWVDPRVLAKWPRLRPRRVIKVRKRNRELAFAETIERLREETMRAIDAASPGLYARQNEVYEEMLLALPATWAQYGQEFGPGVAGEATPFELGFLDFVERDLYAELEQAVLGRSREVAHEALWFPLGVATRAIDLRASSLSLRMLALWAAIVGVVMRAPDSESRSALLERAAQQIGEYGRFYVEPLIEQGDAEVRERGATALLQLFETVTEVCKGILDGDPGRVALLGSFNGVFDKFLVHWQPEYDSPQQWDLDLAEDHGLEQAELDALRAAVQENQAKVAVQERIHQWRDLNRFALLFWILRNIRDDNAGRWREAWDVFAPYLSDVPRLAHSLDAAIEADHRNRGRWTGWILQSFNDDEAHVVSADGDLIQTFIVRALQIIAPSPDAPPPEIQPMEWTPGRFDDPSASVRRVIDDERFATLLPREEIEERARLLIAALEEANRLRKEREDQAVMESALSPKRVTEFEDAFRLAWSSERWLHEALNRSGALTQMEGEPAEEVSGSEVRTWIPKELLAEESRMVGADMSGRQYGQNLAHHENLALADLIAAGPHIEAEDGISASDQLRRALTGLRNEGHAPDLIVLPLNFRLVQALDIEMSRSRGGDVEPPGWLAESHRRSFVGRFDGVNVFELRRMDELILVADLRSFVRWREWRTAEEDLLFQLTAYDEVEAERIARENPQLFIGEGESIAARASVIRRSLLFLAQIRYERVVANRDAAVAVELPEGLRRDRRPVGG